MADRDRNPESSIGEDADTANGTPSGERVTDQLGRAATESDASDTEEAEEFEGLDIVFEREEPETTTH